jgi:uncharacterized integral membrane protein
VLGRIIGLIIGFIAAVFLLTMAVANRHAVRLNLDPFNPENPAISIEALPFYAYLFGMLITGVILGGIATWFGQGKFRRLASIHEHDARRARAEAERLLREREAAVAAGQMAAGGAMARSGGRQLALTGSSRPVARTR